MFSHACRKTSLKGEKWQAVFDIRDIQFVCVDSSESACGEGDFGPIPLTLTHRVVFVCALLCHICNDLLPREP